MGKVDLRMKSGEAFLSRRTFEDVKIVIENGKAELNMEKLNSGGSGQISVYRGDITLRMSPEFPCDIAAHAPKKNVNIDLPIEFTEKNKKHVKGKLNGGGSNIELIAPDGVINLQAL